MWEEWTEPERFADWFGGGESEVPLSTVSMDVRPGGSWRLTMIADQGRREIHWKGEYREVAEPERLVFTLSDQPGDDAYELITVVFTDLGDDRTEMLFQQRGHLSAHVDFANGKKQDRRDSFQTCGGAMTNSRSVVVTLPTLACVVFEADVSAGSASGLDMSFQ